jgi:hypothetical protein
MVRTKPYMQKINKLMKENMEKFKEKRKGLLKKEIE